MTTGDWIQTIVLGGLMGLLGQGIRAAVGLKNMSEDARSAGSDPKDLFVAARLLTSFAIGFLAGVSAVLPMDLHGTIEWHALLPIIAAGYAGTDFIEGFISRYLPSKTAAAAAPIGAAALFDLTTSLRQVALHLAPDARRVVYDSIHETMPGVTFDDATPLAKLLFDAPALAGLATLINRRGIPVDTAAVQACTTVAQVIAACKAA